MLDEPFALSGTPPAKARLPGSLQRGSWRRLPATTQACRKDTITIRLDAASVDHFKQMAAELGMPYQNLINLFWRDCAAQMRRPQIQWAGDAPKQMARRRK